MTTRTICCRQRRSAGIPSGCAVLIPTSLPSPLNQTISLPLMCRFTNSAKYLLFWKRWYKARDELSLRQTTLLHAEHAALCLREGGIERGRDAKRQDWA